MESGHAGDHLPGSGNPNSPTTTPNQPTTRARSRSQLAAIVARNHQLELEREAAQAAAEVDSGDLHQDERKDSGEITAGELRAEMETLLSLRRRSLSQPASVDPDLPPPTSASTSHPPARPSLTIQTTVIPESPAGRPVSPTAPTAAETGTLVRRKSSISSGVRARLPSDHPLPLPSPPVSAPSTPTPHSVINDAVSAAHVSQDLFWLPASLHPELAPQEFKAFIREQTRPEALARRTSMTSTGGRGVGSGESGGMGRMDRRKSMLRGEYKPRQGDGVGDSASEGESDSLGGPRPRLDRTASAGGRRRSGFRGGMSFDDLTISDLQRLEELAAHAEAESINDGEGEGERLGRVLRRSLSLNPSLVAAAAAGMPISVPHDQLSDSASTSSDSPLVVHSPGQILRRSARTKIRKVGLAGDGGGHRFGPSRRARTVSGDLGGSGETAGADGGESDASLEANRSFDSLDSDENMIAGGRRSVSPAGSDGLDFPSPSSSPSSSGHETQYFENAPISGRVEPESPTKGSSVMNGTWTDEPTDLVESTSAPALPTNELNAPLPDPPVVVVAPPTPSSPDFDWSTHHSPHLPQTSGSPVPFVAATQPPPLPAPAPAPSPPLSIRPSPPLAPVKEKKSGWARLGLGSKDDDSSSSKRKGKMGKGSGAKEMEKVMEQTVRQQQIDRERSEREQRERDEKASRESSGGGGGGFLSGLFGKRKSDHGMDAPHHPPTPSPPPEMRAPPQPPPATASGALLPSGRYINFYRLPIHVERAVYRLSHIKLANPRRPLYEQVLISNLMFWYLSIINKPVVPPPAPPQPVPVPIPRGPDDQPGSSPTNSTSSSSSHEQQRDRSRDGPAKRAGLSKPDNRRGGRGSAEYAIKQPQYERQNRQISEEYQHNQYHGQGHHKPLSSYSSAPTNNSIPQVVIGEGIAAAAGGGAPMRSPERSSAPADMYGHSTRLQQQRRVSTSSSDEDAPPSDLDDPDDDRPLGVRLQRESYPPQRPTTGGIALTSPTSPDSPGTGFEPTSPKQQQVGQDRRISNVSGLSERSFDEGDIIDAYGGAVSPVLSKDVAQSPFEVMPSDGVIPIVAGGHAPLFGKVAPRKRGESLTQRAEDQATE